MLAEKVLGTLDETNKSVDFVNIEWFECNKKILRKKTDSGEEIGIKTEATLEDGDILWEDDEKIIAVNIIPSELISISVNSMREMGRLCFEIGNRHLSLIIDENNVKIPYDAPTFEYLAKLGFSASRVTEKFTDYTECHAHSHTH